MPAKDPKAMSAASEAVLAANVRRCNRTEGKMMNSPMVIALKIACAAMIRTLMASSLCRCMKSAVRMVQGAMDGRMYPGSFECEIEKKTIGRNDQMTRNSG